MSSGVTRRDFVATATVAGVAATLGVHAAGSAAADAAQPVARRVSFDAGWRFSRGDFAGAADPGFDDQVWQAVDLPHDWSIAGPYDQNAACGGSGGYLPTGIGWYRKSFALPRAVADRQVLVQFDGIYQASEVWINGQPLGMRPYGYTRLAYDLTPHLHFGGRSNLLSVRVDNSLQPNSRWYSGSGIYRHVWVTVASALHVGHWGT